MYKPWAWHMKPVLNVLQRHAMLPCSELVGVIFISDGAWEIVVVADCSLQDFSLTRGQPWVQCCVRSLGRGSVVDVPSSLSDPRGHSCPRCGLKIWRCWLLMYCRAFLVIRQEWLQLSFCLKYMRKHHGFFYLAKKKKKNLKEIERKQNKK